MTEQLINNNHQFTRHGPASGPLHGLFLSSEISPDFSVAPSSPPSFLYSNGSLKGHPCLPYEKVQPPHSQSQSFAFLGSIYHHLTHCAFHSLILFMAHSPLRGEHHKAGTCLLLPGSPCPAQQLRENCRMNE